MAHSSSPDALRSSWGSCLAGGLLTPQPCCSARLHPHALGGHSSALTPHSLPLTLIPRPHPLSPALTLHPHPLPIALTPRSLPPTPHPHSSLLHPCTLPSPLAPRSLLLVPWPLPSFLPSPFPLIRHPSPVPPQPLAPWQGSSPCCSAPLPRCPSPSPLAPHPSLIAPYLRNRSRWHQGRKFSLATQPP